MSRQHTAVANVSPNHSPTHQQLSTTIKIGEILKIAEIVSWIVLTKCQCISIYEKTGRLEDDKIMIEQIIKKRLETAYKEQEVVIESIGSTIETKIIGLKVKIMVEGKEKIDEVRIAFMKHSHNVKDMLNVSTTLANTNNFIVKENLTKADYEKLEVDVQKQLECYQHTLNMKDVSRNPELILVFNSPRRLLKFEGYPCLMKEIAEILECGKLQEYRVVDYVQSIERYSQIEQRWGL